MDTITKGSELRSCVAEQRSAGHRVAFVPTMGNLHAGHLALVDKAKELAQYTVASIFVNPTQFVAGEDFETYPRTLDQDHIELKRRGIDLLFVPDVRELYPRGLQDQTRVEVPALDGMLCGAFRPGHFAGVATIVTKLFNLVQPNLAIFGEKDYQQLLLIRRLVQELLIPVDIVSVPTVREADGLAMSSRNNYLTEAERKVAPHLYEVLRRTAQSVNDSSAELPGVERAGMQELEGCGFRPEYFSIRRASDLRPPGDTDDALVILAAAWLGRTRLIDHVALQKN